VAERAVVVAKFDQTGVLSVRQFLPLLVLLMSTQTGSMVFTPRCFLCNGVALFG
jgi:hypothetical protein